MKKTKYTWKPIPCHEYYIGTDFAYRPSWWKRLLVFFGLRKRDWDYSCFVVSHKEKGNIVVDSIEFV